MGILALRQWDASRVGSITLILIGTVAIGVLLLVVVVAPRNRQSAPLQAKSMRSRDADAMSYVVTYLVPFVASTPSTSAGLLSLLLLYLVIALIYVQGNLIYINPVLSLLGFRLYEVEPAHAGLNYTLITRAHSFDLSHPLVVRRVAVNLYVQEDA